MLAREPDGQGGHFVVIHLNVALQRRTTRRKSAKAKDEATAPAARKPPVETAARKPPVETAARKPAVETAAGKAPEGQAANGKAGA